MASSFYMMPHSLDGNSTSLPIIEIDQKTHWRSLTQRKRLLKWVAGATVSEWLTLTDRTHTACLCSAACAWQLMPRSWYSQHDKAFNTFKFLPCIFSIFTCISLHISSLRVILLGSHPQWGLTAFQKLQPPKASGCSYYTLQNVDGKSFEMSIGSWWTLSVGYEVEVWLSCNRFKSRILKRYLGEPLLYVRLQSCAPSVRVTLTKPPSVLQKTPLVCQHECSFNVQSLKFDWK